MSAHVRCPIRTICTSEMYITDLRRTTGRFKPKHSNASQLRKSARILQWVYPSGQTAKNCFFLAFVKLNFCNRTKNENDKLAHWPNKVYDCPNRKTINYVSKSLNCHFGQKDNLSCRGFAGIIVIKFSTYTKCKPI